ncbi:hypothetical protein EVAR_54520_1 [Eumeta japonica]|uniref:Uncharacterized protein n=1 Tax=Eumeta variegata TaxID=151549 RepID=A0A4C1YM13_EUMVA|nr:hypothetical protein EVAR_54520_1 [Eumeta japonica]
MVCEICYPGYNEWRVSMVVLGSFFSLLQEWLANVLMRRRRLGSAQHSIPEAALACNILLKHICLYCLLPKFRHIRRESKHKYRWDVNPVQNCVP